MFDTTIIAKRIRQKRIEQNMTQLQLADAIGVSYQAVSNWERGNSMPDISKLEELCGILKIPVDELLGMQAQSTVVNKVLSSQEPISLEEVAQIAPMLPPKQVEEKVTEAKKSGAKINLSTLVGIAPFLDSAFIEELLENVDIDQVEGLTAIAPFLDSEALEKLIRKAGPDSFRYVVSLAPFLSSSFLDAMVEDAVNGIESVDRKTVHSLAPFLSSDALGKLALRCEQDGNLKELCNLAPFLSTRVLDELVERKVEQNDIGELSCLYPFLSSQALKKLAKKMMETEGLDALQKIMPFI